MSLETTPLIPVNHITLNGFSNFVGASKLGPAAVAGCFLAKVQHLHAAETNACCAATRSR